MPKPEVTWKQFCADLLAAGYDEVMERQWAPDMVLTVHTHQVEANAQVEQGRFG